MKKYPYIVAEIGGNHNGDIELGKQMIKAAKECGADAVKFQLYRRCDLWTEDHLKELNDGVVRPSSPKDYNLTVEDIQGTLDTWMNREEEKIVEESVGERVVRTLTELIKTKQGIDVDDYKGNIQMYKFYIDVNDKKYMRFVTFVFNPAVDNNKLYYILDIKGQEYKEVESAFKSKFKDDSYRVMELDLMPHLKAVKGTIDKGAYGTKEQTLGVYLTRVYIPLTSSAGERFKSLF